VPSAAQHWNLDLFEERLDLWIEQENPAEDLIIIVLDWILSRRNDPFAGVSLVEGFDNYWFGAIPNSDDGSGNVVTCSYWIDWPTRTVRCDLFGTLSRPI
jgi:hypothetical protein